MSRIIIICTIMLASSLAGCGVETASTAATVGAMKAKEAEQAQNSRDQIQNDLEAAMKQGQLRLQNAENNAQ